jgi:hypothetical protein
MEIKKILFKDPKILTEFLKNSRSVNKPMSHSVEEIVEGMITADNFRIYGVIDYNRMISFITIRDIVIQKIQVLDLFFIRDNIDLEINTLNQLIDFGIKEGETLGIHRVIEARNDLYHSTNLIFDWQKRYDTFIDETLLPNQFSKYDIIHTYINRQKVFSEKMIYVHYYLKANYYQ